MEGQYLYAIVESGRPLSAGIPGLGARPVYLIPCRGLAAVVSDSPLRPYPADAANAVGHGAVVEEAMQAGPVLPVRFGTLLGGRERVVAMLEEHYEAFAQDLRRLRGKVEMGLKVLWDVARVRGEVRTIGLGQSAVPASAVAGGGSAQAGGSGEAPADAERAPGRSYLLQKLEDHRMGEAVQERGAPLIARIQADLCPLAADSRVRRFPTVRLLLDAAYLVAAEGPEALCRAVERLEGEMAHLRFLLSGPWPPYSFVRLPRTGGLRGGDGDGRRGGG